MFLVRERFVPGEPYRAQVFGVFNTRKFALVAKKVAEGGSQPACAVAEIVPLDLNWRYDSGTGHAPSLEDSDE